MYMLTYVCMYVCMYVCLYVCIYVCMYVCIYIICHLMLTFFIFLPGVPCYLRCNIPGDKHSNLGAPVFYGRAFWHFPSSRRPLVRDFAAAGLPWGILWLPKRRDFGSVPHEPDSSRGPPAVVVSRIGAVAGSRGAPTLRGCFC